MFHAAPDIDRTGREIADSLTDLLITTVHRIGTKEEKRVAGELVADLERVATKPALLFKLAAASIAKPDGSVRNVIFPASCKGKWCRWWLKPI